MAFTSHGHHIPGTSIQAGRNRVFVARCGGLGLCNSCSTEALGYLTNLIPKLQTGLNMEFNQYVRKPFTVEAVEVTTDNITELAQYIGTLKEKDNGTPYIQVDRRLVPNIFRVYPGFYMTRMGDNIRCYSKKIFNEQFVQTTPEINTWVDFMNGETAKSA